MNLIFGFDGDDTLAGLLGNDVLTGGKGKDKFLFNTTLDPVRNVNSIADFQHGKDRIELDDGIFTSLTKLGVLKDKFFADGKHAGDHNDHIVYNEKTGDLSYDADGKGGRGQVLFATLDKHLHLDHHDFLVV